MIIGAHVSIAGGFSKCLDRINSLGGNCLQTFASSPRSLSQAKIPETEIEKYLALPRLRHFFHGVYLVNLATSQKALLKASLSSLISYQQLAAKIGSPGTIFHIGSHQGRGLSETIDQIVRSINEILDSSPKGIKLYLENAAGHAGTVGSTFDELASILSRIGDKSKIGFCLDTQHAFASGYSLDTVLSQFDKAINLKYLGVVHFNDSKTDFSSHVDRHENIGVGKIGNESLKKFLNDSRLTNIPIILEVPGDGEGPRKKDVDTVKSIVVK